MVLVFYIYYLYLMVFIMCSAAVKRMKCFALHTHARISGMGRGRQKPQQHATIHHQHQRSARSKPLLTPVVTSNTSYPQHTTMMKHLLLLLSALTCSVSSFSTVHVHTSLMQRQTRSTNRHQEGLPVTSTALKSAKVLPVAYASASATLLFRATKAATKQDATVLVATALLALLNLAPTDNIKLASAKKADKLYPPANTGKAKQLRQSAKTWRSVVRIKIIGQMMGLLWMATAKTSNGILRGGAAIMAANMAFFLCGAGGARHNDEGESDPMPADTARAVLTIDATMAGAALLAAASPFPSPRRTLNVGIFVVGVAMGALEGVASLIAKEK